MFQYLGSQRDSMNPLGKFITSLPDTLRRLLPPHTQTYTGPLCETASLESQLETTGKQLILHHPLSAQGPPLNGLLTHSSSSLFSDPRAGREMDEILIGVERGLHLKKEKTEDHAPVWNIRDGVKKA